MVDKRVILSVLLGVVLRSDSIQSTTIQNRTGSDILEEQAVKARIWEISSFLLPLPDDEFEVFREKRARTFIPLQAESEVCRNHSNLLLDSFLNKDMWALKFLDSSSKSFPGLFNNNVKDMGNYEQCINTEEPDRLFRGQHCIVIAEHFLPTIPKLASPLKTKLLTDMFSVCVPSSCSDDDVYHHMDNVLAPIGSSTVNLGSFLGLKSIKSNIVCSSLDRPVLALEDYLAICLFSLIISLVLLATCLGSATGVLSSFSLQENFKNLVNTKANDFEISCLNGLRAIVIIMVLMGHRIYFTATFPRSSYENVTEWLGSVTSILIETEMKSIEIFFLIGGVVVSYSFGRYTQHKGVPFNYIQYISLRYFRITPLLAVIVFYNTTLIKFAADGPLWMMSVARRIDVCVHNWWATLLHVSNFVCPNEICVLNSWYLAADFQLHILAPLLLLPLFKRPKLGGLLIVVCVLASTVASTFNAYSKEYNFAIIPYALLKGKTTDHENFGDYSAAYYRGGPFLIGMVLGHHLFWVKHSSNPRQLKKSILLAGWSAFTVVMGSYIFLTYVIGQPSHEFTPWFDPLFFTLTRILYTLCIAWLIYVCALGHGGLVNELLSWKVFRPLAKLSFAIYLVHEDIQITQEFSPRVFPEFSARDQVFLLMGDIVISVLVAVILHLFVEMPIFRLVVGLLKGQDKSNDLPLGTSQKRKTENLPN